MKTHYTHKSTVDSDGNVVVAAAAVGAVDDDTDIGARKTNDVWDTLETERRNSMAVQRSIRPIDVRGFRWHKSVDPVRSTNRFSTALVQHGFSTVNAPRGPLTPVVPEGTKLRQGVNAVSFRVWTFYFYFVCVGRRAEVKALSLPSPRRLIITSPQPTFPVFPGVLGHEEIEYVIQFDPDCRQLALLATFFT